MITINIDIPYFNNTDYREFPKEKMRVDKNDIFE